MTPSTTCPRAHCRGWIVRRYTTPEEGGVQWECWLCNRDMQIVDGMLVAVVPLVAGRTLLETHARQREAAGC